MSTIQLPDVDPVIGETGDNWYAFFERVKTIWSAYLDSGGIASSVVTDVAPADAAASALQAGADFGKAMGIMP
jgi:hypothetical protein